MSSPSQTMFALMKFLHAPDWGASRSVVDAHPELLSTGIMLLDNMIANPALTAEAYRGRGLSRPEAEALLRKHRTVLTRCKQVGVSRAFAELT